jgi:hypothetical protein
MIARFRGNRGEFNPKGDEGSAQEQAVVGETPNLAARLQSLAEPDAVVIAASTRRLVGDLFECRDRCATGAPLLKVARANAGSDEIDHCVRNIRFLQCGNLLSCKLHGNRCDRIIEVGELSGTDDWRGNDRL